MSFIFHQPVWPNIAFSNSAVYSDITLAKSNVRGISLSRTISQGACRQLFAGFFMRDSAHL